MIIDSHAHMDECDVRGWYDHPDRVISFMDQAGIDIAVVSTYRNTPETDLSALKYIAEGCWKYPDRLIPYLRLNPRAGKKAVETLELGIHEYGIKGVKLHPASYNLAPFVDATVDILKMASRYQMPVLFHCSDELMCYPLQIEAAMKKSPDSKVILAHMGGFFHKRDALEVCKRNPNAYMDTCEFPFSAGIEIAIKEIGAERLLFGTDLPTDNPVLEIEKIKKLKMGKEIEDKIFYKNIANLLRLELGGREEKK